MNRHLSIVALFCTAALAGCNDYKKNAVQTIDGPVPAGAWIKFFNFGVNAPGVNFYAGDRKMTAISSGTEQESTNGVAYGSAGAGGLYTTIAAGQYTLSGRIAAAADKDLAISTLSATLEEGKSYSFYQSGFYDATAKTVDAFLVEDTFAREIDYSVTYVQFVNAIPNANPLTLYATIPNAVDASKVDTVAVSGAVAYKSAGGFTALRDGAYNLFARYTGSSTNQVARTGVTFVAGHVYTIGARGDITVTSTTATNRPFLDNTANR